MDCDSPEDIAQKVYSVTGLQVPFMSLYVRYTLLYTKPNCFTTHEQAWKYTQTNDSIYGVKG